MAISMTPPFLSTPDSLLSSHPSYLKTGTLSTLWCLILLLLLLFGRSNGEFGRLRGVDVFGRHVGEVRVVAVDAAE